MARIEAAPSEILSTGAEIVGLGPGIATLLPAARALGSAASEPPATARALERLGERWAASLERLEDDVVALGRAAQASAVAYSETDASAMGGAW